MSLTSTDIGQSDMSAAMGAKLRVVGPSQGLYLVIARTAQLEAMIPKAGGKIAMRLTNGKLLAVLPFEGYLALKSDSRIVRIGPVNLDMQRLTAMTKNLAGAVVPKPDSL
jgi:hypothetical protein